MKFMKSMITTIVAIAIVLSGCQENSTDTAVASDSNSNAVIENIMTRKSVRNFENRQIGKDTIETILKAGMSAPSALNKQPWKFIVVQNKELLKNIADSMPNTRTMTAPMAIVVCGDMTKKAEGTAGDFWSQDCSAASENILLAAHSMGLGAVWTGIYPDQNRVELLRNILQIDSRLVPLCVIPVGYPAENPEPKDKWNTENIEWK